MMSPDDNTLGGDGDGGAIVIGSDIVAETKAAISSIIAGVPGMVETQAPTMEELKLDLASLLSQSELNTEETPKQDIVEGKINFFDRLLIRLKIKKSNVSFTPVKKFNAEEGNRKQSIASRILRVFACGVKSAED